MNKKAEKIIDLLSKTNLLISELVVEVVSQGQLAGGSNNDDLKKIEILAQAVISIGDIEQKFLDFGE